MVVKNGWSTVDTTYLLTYETNTNSCINAFFTINHSSSCSVLKMQRKNMQMWKWNHDQRDREGRLKEIYQPNPPVRGNIVKRKGD